MTNRDKPTASARIVGVERHRHRYEAETEVVGLRSGAVVKGGYPLVDREQVTEWVEHFTSTATAQGHTVEVRDSGH